ncbi:GNAT family N-acetyltransferase [Haloplanus litoreus]|uniref:GNAT family N-acetyltransferase n=1 Tax=Haloplanus litoreus TaxID=767515 RepID=UPI003A905AA9
MRVVDGAVLEADAATVRDRIGRGAVLVATVEGRVVGALVRDGDRVTAVATRRRWRDRGVGTALVSAALAERGRLVVEFDPDVRPFYESQDSISSAWSHTPRRIGQRPTETMGRDFGAD